MIQKIVPHLWFDQEAKEAAQFYTSLLSDSKIFHTTTLHNTPSGDTDLVSFKIWGYSLMAISAGPYFKFNPSISLILNFDPTSNNRAKDQLDQTWNKLMDGGKAIMPLDKYPFSEHYGWVEDRYGFTWQLILTNPEGEKRPNIIPSLLFVGNVNGKAREASDFYLSVFKNSQRGSLHFYPTEIKGEKEGAVMFTDFKLENQWFSAMDSGGEHDFNFNEAVSLIVKCDSQKEIDYYWEKLSAVSEAEQCGWLKDKYGVSWQIVPQEFDQMMSQGNREQINSLTEAFLPMKKLDLAALKRAYEI